jgi:catechol 2,3-dioxygenase-like lactoylglutathione lyase family enzyme/sugar lactone lactonase YvrE
MFLGLPRWTGMETTPSVVRVAADGALLPFPGGAWNAWSPGQPSADAFVQVNALHVFDDDTLWVVDQGTPDRKTVLPGAQKVLQFDTLTGALLRALRFDAAILPEGAQLNDLRIHGDRLYLTESGLGAIIAVDLATGQTLRRLSGHPLLQQLPDRPMRGANGLVLEDAEGARPIVASDLIELTPDGQWLYFSTPTGPMRRVATALLWEPHLTDAEIAATIIEVATVSTLNGSAMDTLGNLYLADAEQRRIEVLAPSGERAVLVADERLIDPDAIFITRDRRLLIPATQNEYLPDHNGGIDAVRPAFQVLSVVLPGTVGGFELGSAIPSMSLTSTAYRAVSEPDRPRGIEHIGITVPDHDAAVEFFKAAFGAETLFSLVRKGAKPMGAAEMHTKNGLAMGTAIVAITMMRLQNGPNVEIFEIDRPGGVLGQGIADFGISHVSLTVDAIDLVTQRFASAGGVLLDGPYPLSEQEEGKGNCGRFGWTPWGMLIEFESFESPIAYDAEARTTRWLPKPL